MTCATNLVNQILVCADGDGFPDGFELSNGLDPNQRGEYDPKFIKLDFRPPLTQDTRMYVAVRDFTGRPRKGASMTETDGNDLCSGLCGISTPTDSRGLAWINAEPLGSGVDMIGDQPMLYPTKDEYPTQGKTHSITVDASPCAAGYDCHDQLTYLATPQGSWLRKPAGDTGVKEGLTPFKLNPGVCVQVMDDLNPQSDEPVVFSVIPGDTSVLRDTARADFKDLVLSAKETMTSKESPNYKLPILYPFLGDDPEDEFQKLTVKTNENGYACVGFYPGNASNFSYKLRASLGGDTEDWIIKTRKRSEMDPRYAVGGYGYLPSTAIVGQQLEIGAMFKQYNYDPTHCNVDTCIIDMLPLSDEIATWSYSLNSGPPINFRDTQLDLNGGTSINWVVGQDPLMAKGDNIEIYVKTWWTETAIAADINAVRPEDVKIKMEKVMFNSSAALPEGGTVASSFLGLSDLGVKVTIENQPSYFQALDLIEQPATARHDMLIAPRPLYYEADQNYSVVFPGEMKNEYFYRLAPQAPRGSFTLKLFDHQTDELINSTTAHIANDYLTFDCNNVITPNLKCDGPLIWRDPNGSAVWGPWKSVSGGGEASKPYLPSLPDQTNNPGIPHYTIYGTLPKGPDDSDIRGGFCDGIPTGFGHGAYGNCWSAPLFTGLGKSGRQVFDPKTGTYRDLLAIHPHTASRNPVTHEPIYATNGCIGLAPAGNGVPFYSLGIATTLDIYLSLFYDMAVIVISP